MPAVSMRTTGIPSYTSSVSMGSRVVPGTGLTRARSSPSSALSSDDLPTFGRPMMASRSAFSSAGGSSSGGGSASSTLSRKSPTPIPCWAETSEGSAKPSSRISCAKCRSLGESALFAATTTRRRERRRSCAISRSTAVRPCRTSSKSTMTSAWSIATFVCASMAAWDESFALSRSSPAVSTTVNSRPRQSATPYNRSRVRPDCGSTMAFRQPRMRLNRVDLPTLGRPTMATMGRGTGQLDRFCPDDLQRLRPEGPAVLVGHEAVCVDRLAVFDRNDQVDVARPGPLGVESRRLRGVVGMAVVVPDDVQPVGVGLALDADVVTRVDLIAITRPLDDDVARPPHLAHAAFSSWPEHDAADLVWVALRAVRLDVIDGAACDLHLRP